MWRLIINISSTTGIDFMLQLALTSALWFIPIEQQGTPTLFLAKCSFIVFLSARISCINEIKILKDSYYEVSRSVTWKSVQAQKCLYHWCLIAIK